MTLSFHGAARSVTGSRHLIQAAGARILLDCGMFQGRRQESDRRNRDLGFDVKSVDAVLVSHAHIDHSGSIPTLAKHGFSGNVYLTEGTGDLTQVLLEDSARLQEHDCEYVNRKERRRGRHCRRPYYTMNDVRKITHRFVSARYGESFRLRPRVKASFHDAGHILGSAAIHLTLSGSGSSTRVLFTGDLGRSRMPILRDPAGPLPCDVLIIESTYGDRLHTEVWESTKQTMQELVAHARAYRSKIIVPAFAVGRTQDLVMRIKELVKEGRIEPLPIYIDSPLRTFTSGGDPFAARFIRYVSSVRESMQLNTQTGPCMIIAASGMCEGGRILHHLKHAIQDEANIILIVGFQAEHTLGRKLVEEWDTVQIFGVPTPRRARVVRLNSLSAHADRNDLLAYLRAISPPPAKVFVVHGEERQSLSLAEAIRAEQAGMEVFVPERGATYEL